MVEAQEEVEEAQEEEGSVVEGSVVEVCVVNQSNHVYVCVRLRACACERVLACVCLRACACVRALACVRLKRRDLQVVYAQVAYSSPVPEVSGSGRYLDAPASLETSRGRGFEIVCDCQVNLSSTGK